MSKNELKTAEKSWLAYEVNGLKKPPAEVAKKYNLSRQLVNKYARHASEGRTYHSKGGAPSKLDEVSKAVVTSALGGEKRIQLSTEESNELIINEQLRTASRRNKAGCQQKPINKKTLKSLKSELGVNTYVAEETTDAREIACANIRNAVCAMAQFHSGSKLAPHAALQYIFDATTGEVGDKVIGNNRRSPTADIIGEVQHHRSKKVRKRRGSQGLTALFVKLYNLMGALGHFAPVVYCIADANMADGDIDWYDMDAGVFGIGRYDKAVIVLCKTRNMCLAFYDKYWMDVVLPFINEERAAQNLTGYPAICNCDGEDMQIDSFSNETFYKAVTEANVVVDKPPASTSEITQACDQELFVTFKTDLLKQTDDDVEPDSTEFKAVANVYAMHQTKMKQKMPAAHVRMGCYGLCRVRNAVQNTFTAPRAKKSFKTIGQWPYSKETVLGQCTTKLTEVEETTIFGALDKLTTAYEAKGELVHEDFEAAKVANNDKAGAKKKEDGATCRMRSVRLTHPLAHAKMSSKAPEKALRKEKRKASALNKAAALASGEQVVHAYVPRKRVKKGK